MLEEFARSLPWFEGFSPGSPAFPFRKTQHSKSHFDVWVSRGLTWISPNIYDEICTRIVIILFYFPRFATIVELQKIYFQVRSGCLTPLLPSFKYLFVKYMAAKFRSLQEEFRSWAQQLFAVVVAVVAAVIFLAVFFPVFFCCCCCRRLCYGSHCVGIVFAVVL